MTNRLANETSTYLLQHAQNPVDWYAWGEEALARAKKEDRPILLSIGYAACHWCHVMEHESFEDAETAQMMNANFVNIKVDREERTDLDEIYMKAVQMMTGHGGWPMTVFLTPDLKPFFGGTYFPPEDRHGLPSFKRLLAGITQAWKNQRTEIENSSNEITAQIKSIDKLPFVSGASLDSHNIESAIETAIQRYLASFDQHWGGFGGAPKFPHTFSLSLTMRYAARIKHLKPSTYEECLQIITTTLDRMAYGGMHDQLGGGFARYSVDREWLVPHFEKMLYDNALLCQTYFDGYLFTGRSYWLRVGCQILDFVLRELKTDQGAFYSSLDADSEGEEGKFYVFTPDEIVKVLGEEDGRWFSEIFGITKTGNFEHGKSVLHLTDSPEKLALKSGISVDQFWTKVDALITPVFQERSKRIRPQRDEKVLVSWNSLMISGFVQGFRITGDKTYLEAAKNAAQFILQKMRTADGRLLRTWGQGRAKLNAYLDDYACFVQALLDLASVDGNSSWYKNACTLTKIMLEEFSDDENGSFFYTSNDHEDLIARPKSHFDGSVPSATSVAIFDLLRLARLSGEKRYLQKAETLIGLYLPFVLQMPDQFANLLCASDLLMADPIEIVLIGDNDSELIRATESVYLPNKVMIVGDSDENSKHQIEIPLFERRVALNGQSTVYICKNYTCDAPITSAAQLRSKMTEMGNIEISSSKS